ncbi:porin [Herbaspirillum sp. ST 5-3]|uniref:porin n=1 Tax=Oxalobacteraceae TaxID=75682 RepID=UPI0010A59308|nr:porin [Herbaspirillum sp. ST 5-3]
MKKSLIALAVLGALASAASAQTSTTIYGLVDAGIVNERGGPAGTVTKLTSGVQNGSRLGFKGNEDLGGGLSAKFLLEAGFNVDTGTSGQGGTLFGRQAYVGLGGNWGNLLFGRQYTPLHTALDQVDPFGTGLAGNIENLIPGGTGPTGVRMNNTIKYTTPEWSGFAGELAYGLGEVAGNNRANRQWGAAVGYVNGPAVVKLVHHRTENATGTDDARNSMIGGKWDFGVAAAHIAFQRDQGFGTVDNRDYMVGVSAPVGPGKVLASYVRRDDRSALNADAHQWALGYTHAVSKRTNFYTSYARITNKNGAAFTVGNATEAGTGDKAFNVGVRHLF